MASSGLDKYRKKRDFSRTSEPTGTLKTGKQALIFVIHKHRARQLHYDLRLEMNGVLKSWAVPKGPSLDPTIKHLAVNVEDHPLEYASFEGSIPEGEYGAGEVIVWDTGTYSPDEGGKLLFDNRKKAEAELNEGLIKGKLSIFLSGKKLKGSFSLVKMQRGENNWLFFKHKDEYAAAGDNIVEDERSAVTGRTLDDVKNGEMPDLRDPPVVRLSEIEGTRLAPAPEKISPMLATLAGAPFSNPDWIFEPKLDGYRTLAQIRDGKVKLLSRNGNDVTAQYEALIPDLSKQKFSEALLDGEIIALDEKGKSCFQCLQDYLRSMQFGKTNQPQAVYPLIFYVFDLLYLDGYDLREVKLRDRKKLLHNTLHTTGQVRLVDYFEKDGQRVYRAAIQNGLEGVVAKRLDSKYESRRSQRWLKIKAMLSDEFVIGGFTQGEGNRTWTFGALLSGQYNDKNELVYTGHVGTGFDEQKLRELRRRLDTLQTTESPFIGKPPLKGKTFWVKPQLVAEIKYGAWTKEGILRIPVFMRLRDDKSPHEVHRMKTMTGTIKGKTQKTLIKDDPPQKPDYLDPALAEILEQLSRPDNDLVLEIGNHKLNLTNLNKTVWPENSTHPAFTKRKLITYLAQVSPYMLTHTKDRPLTLSRYPNGVNGQHFWQKHWPYALPDFVQRAEIPSKEEGGIGEYMLCNNLATLLWLGQEANIEFHTWFSRVNPVEKGVPELKKLKTLDELVERPDFIIFDLDPYLYSGKEKSGAEPELNRKGFEKTYEVALWLKEILDVIKLNAYVKTSGKTGLHVYVPILRKLEYKAVRSIAETIGRNLVENHPDVVTLDWAVEKRAGKIFFDYNQNVRGKTLAGIYSPRPNPEASVSTPLRWEEVGKVYPTEFSIITIPERLKRFGDLWADILMYKKDIENLLDK